MILGVDHVAISGVQADREVAALTALGFHRRLSDTGVANAEQKKKFLRGYSPVHDLMLFDGHGGTAMEITNHRVARVSVPNYGFVPLLRMAHAQSLQLEKAVAPPDSSESIITAFGLGDVRYCWMPELSAPVWITGGDRTELLGLTLLSSNFGATVRFVTEGLGFVPQTGRTNSREWALFTIRSVVPRWRSSLLLYSPVADEDTAQPRLDDAGYPCLALLSNDLAADEKRLVAVFSETEIAKFSLTVGRKPLDFLLATTPGGHIIELIQARKG